MVVFARWSIKPGVARADRPARAGRVGAAGPGLWLAGIAAATACVDERPPLEGTTSLDVELIAPEPGTPDAPRSADELEVTLSIRALDARNELDTSFEGTVDLYAHFLGSLSPDRSEGPLAEVELSGGVSGEIEIELPRARGETFIWAEDVRGEDATGVAGTSARIHYPEPSVVDVRRPEDEGALDALESSPLEGKQVTVRGSRHGESGRLVVSAVFADGYTVEDVACDGQAAAPPCSREPYDAVFVYTFSRPRDHRGQPVRRGDVIASISGAINLFNGLVQFGLPQTVTADEDGDARRIAPPVEFETEWLSSLTELGRAESALLSVRGAEVCPLDDDYDVFGQWKLDVGRGCGEPVNVITEERVEGFEPADYVGEALPEVVGALLPINIGNFHVWIIYPRDERDLELPE